MSRTLSQTAHGIEFKVQKTRKINRVITRPQEAVDIL